MSYTNKARIQQYLLVNISDSFSTQINEWISAVSNYIDNYCGRKFESESATSKLYDGNGKRKISIDDLTTFTKVEILDEDGDVEYTIDDSTEYYLYPANQTNKNEIVLNSYNAPISIFPKGYQNVKVYGTFSFSVTVPEDIRLVATKLVAGIIQESGSDITGEITSEKLGEYTVDFQKVSETANHLGINAILDRYRIIEV